MQRLRRTLAGLLGMLCCAGAVAQGVAEGLAAAQQKIEGKQWAAALEVLLPLCGRGASSAEMEQVANALAKVGEALGAQRSFATALRAFEASLEVRLHLYGDADHSSVAMGLNKVAGCLQSLGRAGEALAQYEAALAMCKRLYGVADHLGLAITLNNAASCLESLGRASEALPHYEAALAMCKRLYGVADHPEVARGLNNVASCLSSLGRAGEALPQSEAALAMQTRLHGDADHPHVARSLNNVAYCLQSLGRAGEALPLFEASLAMRQRLYGVADHPDVAGGLNNVAYCLNSLGRAGEALPQYQSALAMKQRLYGVADHPAVAAGLNNVAHCLDSLGRKGEALPQFEAALAMSKRLYGEADHPDVAQGLNNVAYCLQSLGRVGEALPQYEASLAMYKRLYNEADHPNVAQSLNNVAHCLESLGRASKALLQFEAALAMRKRLYSGADHPVVAQGLNNVANCLGALGRVGEALPHLEASLAMRKRLYGEADHPDVAQSLNNVASCLVALGRVGEALPQYEASLAMWKRLYGEADHPDVAQSLNNVAGCLTALSRAVEALPRCEQAVIMIERLRDQSRTSATLRQSLFDKLKSGGAFERLQSLTARLGRHSDSLAAAERGRGRELLDLLEQQRHDAFALAALRARQRGDEAAATRLGRLREELETAELESERLLHLMTQLADAKLDDAERTSRRQALLTQSSAISTRHRELLDERARMLGDVLPVGRVRTPAEIQSALRDGELLLEFTLTEDVSLLYVLAREGEAEVIALPTAHATVQRLLPELLRRTSKAQLAAARGRDPEATSGVATTEAAPSTRELFTSLIPATVWARVQTARLVFVAGHRELHRLPFELLVTELRDSKPITWLENGPPISYVPSGSALHWLRQRAKDASDDTTTLDLLAVGDPSELVVEPEVPELGVLVVAVNDGGEGARVGLQPRDVLLSYDGQALIDDKGLRDARMQTEVAIEDGNRAGTSIPIEVWRRGETLRLEVQKGVLGIQVAPGRSRLAFEASLHSDARMERITRSGDLERLRQLPPLRGARIETQAIETVFSARQHKTRRLLGAEATEPSVFDLAPKAKYLHFACHGLAEEYAGQSLSMLVLSQPEHVLPGDDGLLKLGDLLHNWPGRLSSCRLVVLSACRTNVGPTLRDEAPQALPIGFLFAGVPAVISSLWAVDDDSTRELMTDFYGRLLAGETDKLAAFTAAKKALRAKYPDPFHWAPFLYIGSPE